MPTVRFTSIVSTSLFGLLLLALTGCQRGPALGTVEGTVRVNGRPLPHAYVVFQPISPPGAYGSAYADKDGEYVLQFSRSRNGAPVGKHRVSIRAARNEEVDDSSVAATQIVIPDKFNSATELEREVKAGHNVHDFNLDVPLTLTSLR